MSTAAAPKSGQKVDLLLPAVFLDDSIICHLATQIVDRSGSCVHFAAALLRKIAVLIAD